VQAAVSRVERRSIAIAAHFLSCYPRQALSCRAVGEFRRGIPQYLKSFIADLSLPLFRPTLGNRITLDQFKAAAEKVPLPLREFGLTESLRRDLPLRCLAAACQAFWS
jgi:hypothetical protein